MKALLKRLRRWLYQRHLRGNGVQFGAGGFAIGRAPVLRNAGRISLGQRVAFRSFREPARLESAANGHLHIGDDVFINDSVNIFCGHSVDIGAHTKIGDGVTIYDSDFHPVAPDQTPAVLPVRIGRNVWIGARAMILAGAQVGDHAVIGAGSVVRGVVPARSVVSGIPARAVRQFECADDWVRP